MTGGRKELMRKMKNMKIGKKLIKHLLRKSLYPGQQDQLRTPSAYVYRIELYTALLFYKLQDSPFSFKPVSAQKAMSPQQKTPRLLPG